MGGGMTLPTSIIKFIALLDSFGFTYGHTRISLYRALLAALVVVGTLIVARIASGGVRAAFRRITRLDPTEKVLGEKLVGIGVWVVCILVGLDVVGIDVTALTVFSGAIGLAVGFGLQKTFGNLLAGIILLMDRSINPGDVISVGNGNVGQVKKIGLRAVSVITRDKVEYLIPNENLMVNQVENWSYSSRDVRVKVPVPVAYGSDIDLVERLLLEAARKTERVLGDPAPSAWLQSFGDSALIFEVQIWIDDPEDGIGNVRSDLLKAVWHLFRDHGVEVPVVQRDVRMRGQSAK
jgi:small-conductance mechanosensitive channel